LVYKRVCSGFAENGVDGVLKKLFTAGLGDEAKRDWSPRILMLKDDGPPYAVVWAREVRAHYLAGHEGNHARASFRPVPSGCMRTTNEPIVSCD